jgi:glycosyltransferase involved in cell wall biosynthesis
MAAARPIVMISHEFFPKRGGIAVYVEETARAAVKRGHPVEVWAQADARLRRRNWPFAIRELEVDGRLPWRDRLHDLGQIRRNAARLREGVLWLPEVWPILTVMYGRRAGFLPPLECVLTLHGSEILRIHRRPHQRCLFSGFLRQVKRIGVVSRPIRELLYERFPLARDCDVVLVPGALRHDLPSEEAAPRAPAEGEAVTFLTLGRIHPRKGQHLLVEALAALPEASRRRVVCEIAGPFTDRSYKARIEQAAHAGGVAVKLLGDVPDDELPALFRRADVFALTSQRTARSIEGLGLVYLEAYAYGLPVLAHQTGGVGDAVVHEETGLLVEPGDRAGLTRACERLIASAQLRHSLGAGGQRHLQQFSWERNVEALFA